MRSDAAIAKSPSRIRLSAFRVIRLLLAALLIAASPARAASDDTTRQTSRFGAFDLADIETALKADNLSDSDLVRLRAEGDPLAAQLQAVIAELSPRLDASAKRLAELTPKSKESRRSAIRRAPSSPPRSRSTTRSTPTCARRARCCCRSTTSTRASARRGAICSPARPSRARRACSARCCGRAGARGAGRRRALSARCLGDWLHGRLAPNSAVRRRSAFSPRAGDRRARGAATTGSRAASSRAISRSPRPSRFRRALGRRLDDAGARRPCRCSRSASSPTRSTSSTFPIRALQGALDASLDGLRLLVDRQCARARAAGARPCQLAARSPERPRPRALFRALWLGVAAILAVERLLEPAADAVGSLNITVAGRAVGATLVALFARRARSDGSPPGRARPRARPGRRRAPLAWLLVGG